MGVLYFSGRSPVCFLREEVLCVLGRGLQAGPVLSRRSTLSPLASASLHLVPRRSPPSRPRPRPVPRTAWPPTESAFVPRRAACVGSQLQKTAASRSGRAGRPSGVRVRALLALSSSPAASALGPAPRPSAAFHPRAGLQGFLAARCGDSLGTSASANISRPPRPPLAPAAFPCRPSWGRSFSALSRPHRPFPPRLLHVG